MATLFAFGSNVRWGQQELEALARQRDVPVANIGCVGKAFQFTSTCHRYCTAKVSIVEGDTPFWLGFLDGDIQDFSPWTYVGLDGRVETLEAKFSDITPSPMGFEPGICWWYEGEIISTTPWALESLTYGFLCSSVSEPDTCVVSLETPFEWSIPDGRDLPDFAFLQQMLAARMGARRPMATSLEWLRVRVGELRLPWKIGGEFVQEELRLPCFLVDRGGRFLLLCSERRIPVAGPFRIERSVPFDQQGKPLCVTLGQGTLSDEHTKRIAARISQRARQST